jgi:hypothetical protein
VNEHEVGDDYNVSILVPLNGSAASPLQASKAGLAKALIAKG